MTAVRTEPRFQQIDIDAIAFASSASQSERRKHFDQAQMKDLVESVKEKGVVQPIVVRLGTAPDGLAGFELVAGERRVLAARQAGLTLVPAMVHDLSDEQAEEVRLIENLQREDLSELAEAEGYETLLKRGLTADQIADKVAKSKSHVYARMKLIALCPAAREAYYAGTINASVALLIARIPVHELQERALKRITELHPYHKEPMSYREAQEYVRDEFTLKLSGAPFPKDDAELVPTAGACAACPKRTGNQPADLFGDIKSADVCTDPVCFRGKRDAHQKRELERARATGTKVISAHQARGIIPKDRGYMSAYSSDGSHKNLKKGYARPSDKCLDDPKKRTYAELAGKDAPTVLIQDPDTGRTFKAFEVDAIKDRLEAKGVKPKPPAADPAEQRLRDRAKQEKQQAEQMTKDIAVFRAVFEAAPKKLEREDLLQIIARHLSEGGGDDEAKCKALGIDLPNGSRYLSEDGWLKLVKDFSDTDLVRLVVVLPALDGIDGYGDTPELDEFAKRFGVDAKKIRKDALTPAAAAPAITEKPKAVKAKKKGRK